jgi:hypothetical protein
MNLPSNSTSASPFWRRDKLIYLLLSIFGVSMVVIAITITPTASAPTEPAEYSGVRLPADYETRFIQYAAVQRPDGTSRRLYINPEAIDAIKNGSTQLPNNTIIVIDGYYAQSDTDGGYEVDPTGRYINGDEFEMLHVIEKRNNWSAADFVSENRVGNWNFGSFDTRTGGYYDENMSACFHCHNATSRTDFLYSLPLLRQYLTTQEIQFFVCDLPDRLAC